MPTDPSRIVPAICRKYLKAKDHLKESQEAFEALNRTTDRGLAKTWARQAKEAQAEQFTNPEAMLIYDVQLEKGAKCR